MKIEPTPIAGAFVVRPQPVPDERGSFGRVYCFETFRAAGVTAGPIRQMSLSVNRQSGTLRGMHWQAPPMAEAKLVRVIAGRIFDVIIDLRLESPSFRRWFGLELDAAKAETLVIPPYCAHGFLTLEPDSVIDYAMDADYAPGYGRGLRWNDPAFGIEWPAEPIMLSERDRTYPDFDPMAGPV